MVSHGSPYVRRRSSNGLLLVGLSAGALAALIGAAAVGDFLFDLVRPDEVRVVIPLPRPAVTMARLWQKGNVNPRSRASPTPASVEVALSQEQLWDGLGTEEAGEPEGAAAPPPSVPAPSQGSQPRDDLGLAVTGEPEDAAAPPPPVPAPLQGSQPRDDSGPEVTGEPEESVSPPPRTAPQGTSDAGAQLAKSPADEKTDAVSAVSVLSTDPDDTAAVVLVSVPVRSKPTSDSPPSLRAPVQRPASKPFSRKPDSIFGTDLPNLIEVASAGGRSPARLPRRNVVGWNNIRWGATEAQLKRLFGGALEKYDAQTFEAYRADYYLKGVRYFSMGFDVIFQVSKSNGRLAQVLIDGVGKPSRGDFAALYATMRRIYGEPTSRENYLTDSEAYFGVDPAANIYKKAIWRFPTTTIQLTVLTGPAFFRATKGWLYLRYYPSRSGRS